MSGKIVKRTWTSRGPLGQRVRRVAYGYTVQIGGKQERRFDAAWDKAAALQALATRVAQRDQPAPVEPAGLTFGQAVAKYLEIKSRKRSLRDDRQHLAHLTAAFGADTPLEAVTAARISDYRAARMAAPSTRTGRPLTAAAINRPLAALRHLLRLAVDEWGVLDKAPTIRLEKEPEGRVRWLEPAEQARLLAACAASKNTHLAAIVTVALETGMRSSEVLGLTWEDSIDMARGVIRLERTKSGRRREVPMRQAVYDLLAKMPTRTGRLWPDESIRTAFENAVEAAKVGELTFHDLRHSFASWFVMRGGSLQALREILGHRDIKLTLRYAHLAPGHLRAEIEKTAEPFTHKSAQSGTLDADSPVSPRKAGVAQRQSN
jgi:integrase